MQTISEECADKYRRLKTTDGTNKTVTFNVTPNDGSLYIILKTNGKFKIKIGYYYTFCSENPETNEPCEKQLNKYIIIEEILDGKNYQIDIPIGWNWTIGYDCDNDIDESFWDEHEGEGYVKSFDVIELEQLDDTYAK